MVQLDILGIFLTLFILGPKYWRWSLGAVGISMVATLLLLIIFRADLIVYTMGGLFTQVELRDSPFWALLLGLAGPFASYTVAKIIAWRPMGETGWSKQLLPWSELENIGAGTLAKYALLAAVFSAIKNI